MKKNIAIVAGGDSSEAVVSLKSAQGIYAFIDKKKYNTYIVIIQGKFWRTNVDGNEVEVDKNDFSFQNKGQKISIDCAYITIHGTPGENGLLQGYFDMINMPYTSCGVLVSALTFNKFVCNTYLKGYGINVAESLLLRQGRNVAVEDIIARVGLPCFVKPNAGGSSFGVSKVRKAEEFPQAIEKAFTESDEVIIEAFIQGTEVTNGIYKTKTQTVILPITEVRSENDFFDYEAKYTQGKATEITPARLTEDLTQRIKTLTAAIYDILCCKGIVRMDYIIQNDEIFLLEVNVTPGMTPTSFIPQQVAAQGLNITQVFTDIIEEAMEK